MNKTMQQKATFIMPLFKCMICGKNIEAFYGRHGYVNYTDPVGTCSKACEQKYYKLP